MKYLPALCVLAFVALSTSSPNRAKRCIYVEGKCFSECEEGTYSYTTGCSPVTPEPTCDQPKPVEEEGSTCDYSACYCIPPTVRDSVSGKCVPLEKCPKKE